MQLPLRECALQPAMKITPCPGDLIVEKGIKQIIQKGRGRVKLAWKALIDQVLAPH